MCCTVDPNDVNTLVMEASHQQSKTNTCACTVCGVEDDTKHTLQCDECREWVYCACTDLPWYQLMYLFQTTRKYSCEKCGASKLSDESWATAAREAQEAVTRQKVLISQKKGSVVQRKENESYLTTSQNAMDPLMPFTDSNQGEESKTVSIVSQV